MSSRTPKGVLTVLVSLSLVFSITSFCGCSLQKKEIGPFEYVRKGQALLDSKDYRKAIKNFERAHGILPENDIIKDYLVYGYTLHANDLWQNDKLDSAIEVLEKAYVVDKSKHNTAKNLTSAYVEKASGLASRKDYANALDYLRKANLISGGSQSLKKRLAQVLFGSAQEAFNKQDYETAVLCLIESNRLINDKGVLELLGDIYYERSSLDLALHYWNKIKAGFEGDLSEIDEKCKKAREELEIEKSTSSFETGNFLVKIEGSLALDADEIRPILEEAYTNVGGDFDFYPPKRTEVILYSKETFRDIFKQPNFVAAFYDGKIRLPVSEAGLPPVEFKRYIFHEYTHAMVSAITNNNCPVWFNEGLATYEEGHVVAVSTGAFKAFFLKKGAGFDLLDLEKAFEKRETAEDLAVYYQGSYTVVKFIVDRWGLQKLSGILRRLRERNHIFNAIEDVLPLSIRQFEGQWREYIEVNS